jgi:pimeloyl-ACP methyl ester carboxylesterase
MNAGTTATPAPTTGYAPVNGLEMYYEVHGTGRPLVLLHGGLLTLDRSFGAMIPGFAATRQVIAVELQGHGRTADIEREFSFENLADDVVALLDHLGIERADVFGFSLGGLTAMSTALRHPERVGRLVVASIHFRPDGYHAEIRDPVNNPGTRMPTEADFRAMHDDYVLVAPDPDGFDAFAAKASAVVGAFAGWSDDELRSVAVPTLVLVGDHDFVLVEHATEMFHLIPDANLAVLPATTHMDMTRRADLVLPVVESFLRGA